MDLLEGMGAVLDRARLQRAAAARAGRCLATTPRQVPLAPRPGRFDARLGTAA
jgi:hypothetical protein